MAAPPSALLMIREWVQSIVRLPPVRSGWRLAVVGVDGRNKAGRDGGVWMGTRPHVPFRHGALVAAISCFRGRLSCEMGIQEKFQERWASPR